MIPKRPTPSPSDLQTFDDILSHQNFQKDYYAAFRDFRDLDYESLRKLINRYLGDDSKIRARDMEALVFQFAANNQFVE